MGNRMRQGGTTNAVIAGALMSASVWLTGCVSGDSNGSGTVGESGVSASKAANSLTTSEARAVCMDIQDQLSANRLESSCMTDAVLGTEDSAACQAYYDACVAEGPAADGSNDLECDTANVATDLATCEDDVTAGAISDCMISLLNLGDNYTCADAGKATIPSCYDTLSGKCPTLFSD